jgi:hypothetical protein
MTWTKETIQGGLTMKFKEDNQKAVFSTIGKKE